jgi:hypothetical protein
MPRKEAKPVINSHRGRFQAQGTGCNDSEPWSQPKPLTLDLGNHLLTTLSNKIPKTEMMIRRAGFQMCSEEITAMSKNGGFTVVDKAYRRSFPNARRDRVDLEIHAGTAFILKK